MNPFLNCLLTLHMTKKERWLFTDTARLSVEHKIVETGPWRSLESREVILFMFYCSSEWEQRRVPIHRSGIVQPVLTSSISRISLAYPGEDARTDGTQKQPDLSRSQARLFITMVQNTEDAEIKSLTIIRHPFATLNIYLFELLLTILLS